MKKLVGLLAFLKFRFDVAQGFLNIVSFIFILISASDKLATLTHLSATVTLLVFVPLIIGIVLVIGYLLVKLKFQEAYTEELNKQNKMLKDICQNFH